MSFRLRQLRPSLRHILMHGYTDPRWREDSAWVDRLDSRQRSREDPVPLHRRHTGGARHQRRDGGGPGRRQGAGADVSRADAAAGADPVGPGSVHHPVDRRRSADAVGHRGRRAAALRTVGECPAPVLSSTSPTSCPRRVATELTQRDKALLRLASSAPVRKRFADAWVLMDRIHDADDSAEVLFRYLRKSRPKINAWFVIQSGTPDWERLREAGYKRIVTHGSTLWKLLMLNARHLISSHADVPVIAPPEIVRLARADLAVHLPAARCDQGRPVGLAEPQVDRHVRDQHATGVRLDRGRRQLLRVHEQGSAPHRSAPLRQAAPHRQEHLARASGTWCC